MLRDAVMLDTLMHSHGYYYGNYGSGYYSSYHHSGGFFTGLLSIIFLVVCAILVIRLLGF